MNNRTTGPVDLPPLVRQAINRQMISHRSMQFKSSFSKVINKLQWLLGTNNRPMIFTCSGTGGLEAAIVNTLCKGDKVLALSCGYYGELFAKIAEKHVGATVTLKQYVPGTPITADSLPDILKAANFTAILLTHSESSTGVLNPIAELTKTIRNHSDALILVDAISSVGTTEFLMDDWGVDVLITAPQKGLMAPPGTAIICASDRAHKKNKTGNVIGSFYFDFAKSLNAELHNQTPWTPAILSIWGLEASLDLIDQEGLTNVYSRHRLVSKKCQNAVLSAGFKCFAAENFRAPGITSILLPETLLAKDMQRILEADYGILVGTGIGEWESKMLRIGHMGWVFEENIEGLLQPLSNFSVKYSD